MDPYRPPPGADDIEPVRRRWDMQRVAAPVACALAGVLAALSIVAVAAAPPSSWTPGHEPFFIRTTKTLAKTRYDDVKPYIGSCIIVVDVWSLSPDEEPACTCSSLSRLKTTS
jgi:hypothetical protein